MTPDERRRQLHREASQRFRDRNPEYREREKERRRRGHALQVSTPEGRQQERERIALWRATHPLQNEMTEARHNAGRRLAAQRRDTE